MNPTNPTNPTNPMYPTLNHKKGRDSFALTLLREVNRRLSDVDRDIAEWHQLSNQQLDHARETRERLLYTKRLVDEWMMWHTRDDEGE